MSSAKLVMDGVHIPITDFEFSDNGIDLFTATGERLRLRAEDLALGTFSNAPSAPPAPAPTLEGIMAAFEALREPPLERAEFGEVSLALFWVRLQSVKATELADGQVEIEVKSVVPDRDTARFLGIIFKITVPGGDWARPEARAQWLRFALLKWLTHELDEHLFVGGQRARDPHVSEAPPKISFVDPGLDFQYHLPWRGLR